MRSMIESRSSQKYAGRASRRKRERRVLLAWLTRNWCFYTNTKERQEARTALDGRQEG